MSSLRRTHPTSPADPPGRPSASSSSPEPVISLSSLHVSFMRGGHAVHALRGVSLDVMPGEIVGLVGESGSGKSVLGLTLLGLLPDKPRPTISGRAMVCGTDMVTASREDGRKVRKEHMGAVFQDPMTSLNPTMRVGRQVAEAAGTEAEALRLLDAVGVPEAKRRLRAYPHELSGGLRQRVMIAMAVAGSPSLVIADEPTTALDVTVQAQILELLASLRDEFGTSFILVTHDLGVAAQVADRIAVLYGSRLAEVGNAEDVLQRPVHPYTEALLRSRLVLDSDRSRPIVTLPGEPPDPRAHPPGCPFSPRCALHVPACDVALPELETVSAPAAPRRLAACIRWNDRTRVAIVQKEREPWTDVELGLSGGAPPATLIHDVHKTFPIGSGLKRQQLHALRGVTLEVNKGEALALVGESGCGKSTLLRSIAGLQPVNSGSIEFGRGARPQMVFQDAGASLTPWLTIGELISERLRAEPMTRAERGQRMQAALRQVGLPPEVAESKPMQLSGGQRQRAALARATVVPPDVLLCDEPTSALDVSLAATVLNLIGQLRRDLGMAVIFVTHDLAAARVVADRIAVMYLGRIVELGPSDQICSSPAHPYTQALLAAVPDLARRRVRLDGEPASALDPPSGCEFHPRCPGAIEACATAPAPLVALGGPSTREVACPVFLARDARERRALMAVHEAFVPTSPGRRGIAKVGSARKVFTGATKVDRFGLILLGLLVVMAVFAPLIAPYSPTTPSIPFIPPLHAGHLFGTDEVGYDIFSRCLYGLRSSMLGVIIVVTSGVVIGGLVGLVAGVAGGWLDALLMRITDLFLALPSPLLAIAIASALGASYFHVLLAVAIVWWPFYARIMRGEVRALAARPHLEAAALAGAGPLRRGLRHLLPGAMPAIIVTASLDVGNLVVTLAGLSFLGLGAPAPAPELGAMSARGLQFLLQEWWVPVMPAVVVFLLALGANMSGDAIADSTGQNG